MKKIVSILLSVIVMTLCALPCSAATMEYRNTEVQPSETLYLENNISVTRTVVTTTTNARASTQSGYVTNTYRSGSTVIAEVTLYATFSYNGLSASVVSANSDYRTYGSWSYGSESLSKSGGTAKLSARLTKSFTSPVSVNMSLTCSPTGQLS